MTFKRIGIFDSGIGGLSLVKELLTIPGLELIYYADTAHVPYGNRSKEEIEHLSSNAVSFLLQYNVDAIIIACHTATTNALSFLKAQFPRIHFIDVVELIIQQALQATTYKIGILGTQATINSGIHKSLLAVALPNCTIFTQACPRLASAIENNLNDTEYLTSLINDYCKLLRDNKIDALVLACTHYALIKDLFAKFFDTSIKLISAEQLLQRRLEPFLNLNAQQATTIKIYTTASLKEFLTKVSLIIDQYTFARVSACTYLTSEFQSESL
jgi:glutamate racemase